MQLDEADKGSLAFRLDHASGVPTYLQLVRQVEDALRLSRLVPGDQLPTVKDVVASLAINPNTVLKAYRELEHKGIAAGRPGLGTFINTTLDSPPLKDFQALRKRLDRWLADAFAAGFDQDDISALFNGTLHAAVSRGSKAAS
ncbi:GntR family transcriptional regulator [uncultured Jatrophihabitans sp.]|uniref:GntR family transcriptional regulator n=1 Tax=uncultured Jatrophihabitans sp. TaxID=1610747 RepID=UPI0035CAB8CA